MKRNLLWLLLLPAGCACCLKCFDCYSAYLPDGGRPLFWASEISEYEVLSLDEQKAGYSLTCNPRSHLSLLIDPTLEGRPLAVSCHSYFYWRSRSRQLQRNSDLFRQEEPLPEGRLIGQIQISLKAGQQSWVCRFRHNQQKSRQQELLESLL